MTKENARYLLNILADIPDFATHAADSISSRYPCDDVWLPQLCRHR